MGVCSTVCVLIDVHLEIMHVFTCERIMSCIQDKIRPSVSNLGNECMNMHRVLHTPMISPNNYMHVHMYTHVNTCMYARLDVVII